MLLLKQGVTLTGRNRTGPPCSGGRPTAHTPGSPARRHRYRRRRTCNRVTPASKTLLAH